MHRVFFNFGRLWSGITSFFGNSRDKKKKVGGAPPTILSDDSAGSYDNLFDHGRRGDRAAPLFPTGTPMMTALDTTREKRSRGGDDDNSVVLDLATSKVPFLGPWLPTALYRVIHTDEKLGFSMSIHVRLWYVL